MATASANDVVFGGVVAGRALGSILLEVVSRAGDTQGVWLKWSRKGHFGTVLKNHIFGIDWKQLQPTVAEKLIKVVSYCSTCST